MTPLALALAALAELAWLLDLSTTIDGLRHGDAETNVFLPKHPSIARTCATTLALMAGTVGIGLLLAPPCRPLWFVLVAFNEASAVVSNWRLGARPAWPWTDRLPPAAAP